MTELNENTFLNENTLLQPQYLFDLIKDLILNLKSNRENRLENWCMFHSILVKVIQLYWSFKNILKFKHT